MMTKNRYISQEQVVSLIQIYFNEYLQLNPDILIDGIISIPDDNTISLDEVEELKGKLARFEGSNLGYSCRNETIEHLKAYNPSFDKKGAFLYRIALNIAEVADQLAEQNGYVIASSDDY
jgi:hypothetical protein